MLNKSRRTLASLVALGVIAAVGGTLAAPAALACGGFFCMRTPIDQAGERILFVQDGELVTAYVQIQYQGDAKKFSWVVPVPAEPALSVGSDALFTAVRNATRPQFNLNLRTEGTCKEVPYAQRAAQPTSAGAANGAVNVVSQDQVGPYDSAVLQSNDPQALKTWLRENEYDLPQTLDPLLDPYVTGKYYFVALKLQQDRGTGDLQPIVLKYKADRPGIPIRLTAVAATEDMDVYVWVLGEKRAIPENYRHAQINEARIDWLSAGSNYRQVVSEAMNEAGGQAFVTDYAGQASGVPLQAFDTGRFDLVSLKALTQPEAFLRAVANQGYFPPGSQQALSFFKRYVPKPDSQKDVADNQFYNGIINGFGGFAFDPGVLVDTAKAVKELEDSVITPYKDIKAMFQQHTYLTAMYTTMSPKEMTIDPTFLYNGEMPTVSNIHEADGVQECSGNIERWQAPIKITLKNGISFYASSNSNTGSGNTRPVPIDMPAAARIEQLKTSGGASVIQDNADAIKKTIASLNERGSAIAVSSSVNGATGGAGTSTTISVPRTAPKVPATGFSCAGCASTNQPAVPVSEGGNEIGTYALMLLGFLGYRRWSRRR